MDYSTIPLAVAASSAVIAVLGAVGMVWYEMRQVPRRLAHIQRNPHLVHRLAYRFSRLDGQLKLYAVFPNGRKKAIADWENVPAALAQLRQVGLR